MRKQEGITLIALVITIIVLLILAGVSIAMLTGSNGILTKATEAGDQTAKAEIREQVTLAINEILMNKADVTNTATGTTQYQEVTRENIIKVINYNVGNTVAKESTTNNVIEYSYGNNTYNVTLKQTDSKITGVAENGITLKTGS